MYLKHFLKELGKCAEAVPSHQEKGYWHLTVSPTKCNSATGNDPVIPGQPPEQPVMPDAATQYQINGTYLV